MLLCVQRYWVIITFHALDQVRAHAVHTVRQEFMLLCQPHEGSSHVKVPAQAKNAEYTRKHVKNVPMRRCR